MTLNNVNDVLFDDDIILLTSSSDTRYLGFPI